MQLWVVNLLLIFCIILLSVCKCEDITLKCDETPNEPFCTVSNFIVSHSQNVKVQTYSKSNMTKFMRFYGSRLLYVPYKLFDVFSGLKTLDVSFTEILDIPRNTFGAASYLTYLNMSYNNITAINTSVFSGANNLLRLDLSHNYITQMSEYAFRGLTSLDILQLSYNRLSTLGKDIFSENPYMESVYLDNNRLEYIDPAVFNRSRRIREVNLSNNRLLHIHPQTFQSAYMLDNLLLDYNELSEFQLLNKSITSQLKLDHNRLGCLHINGSKYVSANHNVISKIIMINSNFLETLDISYNNIQNISNITHISTDLYVLDLSYNPIGPLNISSFDRLRWLFNLKLRATGIQNLEFGMFSKNKLELLDLSYNNLSELNIDIFVPYLVTLKQLYVDANNLTEIQGKHMLSSAFPNLQKLGISRNRFNCSYLHTLLTSPSLSAAVELHIEPEPSIEVTSHIRDITCISSKTTKRLEEQLTNKPLIANNEHIVLLQQLQQHAHHLEIYLLLLKIALFLVINLTLVLLVMQLWKFKRRSYFVRSGASILFRSDATVNTNIEHH